MEREAALFAAILGGYGGSRMNVGCTSVSSHRFMGLKVRSNGETPRGPRADLDRDGVVEMTK
jgi:hypothetical protein